MPDTDPQGGINRQQHFTWLSPRTGTLAGRPNRARTIVWSVGFFALAWMLVVAIAGFG